MPQLAFAGHNSGLNIAYTCLGGNQYEVTVNLFRDCADTEPITPTLNVYIYSSCQTLGFFNFPLFSSTEVSQLCPAALPFSNCAGGTEPGIELNIYRAVVSLDPCADWRIVVAEQNRSPVVNLINPGLNRIHVEAFLNNASGACNTSAAPGVLNLPYVCVAAPLFYNLGFAEPDGDSLVYSLAPALTSLIAIDPFEMAYPPPYSPAAPITGMAINPSNGQITLSPSLTGIFNTVVRVDEYRNGELIGQVSHDFLFLVNPCPVPTPAPVAGSLSHVSGGGYPLSNSSIGICPGDDFCFEISFSSADPGYSVSMSSTIQALVPGSSLSVVGSNPATGQFCGSVPSDFEGGTFLCIASDDACPVMGQTFFAIDFVLREPLQAGTDTVVCAGQDVPLFAVNGGTHTWSYPNGDALLPGSNFSCNPCGQPIFVPDSSTILTVSGVYPGSTCPNTQQVQVSVPLTWSISTGNESCNGNDGSIAIDILDGSGSYEVQWNDIGSGPLVRNDLTSGTYSVMVQDLVYGCSRSASFTVQSDPYPTASAGPNTSICALSTSLQAVPSFGAGTWLLPAGLSANDASDPNTNITATATGSYLLTWIEDAGGGCADTATVLIEMLSRPSIENPEWTCTGIDATYILGFDVAQGNPSAYVVSGIGGELSNGSFLSAPLASQSLVEVVLSDGGICGNDTLQGSLFCAVLTFAGSMAPDTLRACGSDTLVASQIEAPVTDGNDVLRFALHTASGSTLGDVLAWNSSPSFAYQAGINYDETYYISAVVGNALGDEIDLNDPFLSVAAGSPVQFFATPVAALSGSFSACPYDTLWLLPELSGSMPQSLVYSINGQAFTANGVAPGYSIEAIAPGEYALISTSSAWCDGQVAGSATVSHYNLPEASANLPAFLCAGDTAWLEVTLQGEAPFSFALGLDDAPIGNFVSNTGSFTLPVVAGGNFTITQLQDLRCATEDTTTVYMEPRPMPNATLDPPGLACTGDTLLLGSLPQQGHSYSWLPHPGLLSAQGAQVGFSLAIASPAAESYTLYREAVLNGCFLSDSLQLVIYPYPEAGISGLQSFCAGDSIYLFGYAGQAYSWTPASLFAEANSQGTWFSTHTNTSIALEVSNAAGCTAGASAGVEVWPNPKPILVADATEGCAPLQVKLDVLNPIAGTTYAWHIGKQILTGGPSFEALLDAPGTWDLSVNATTAQGCEGSEALAEGIEVYDTYADFYFETEGLSIAAPQVYFQNQSPAGVQSSWTFAGLGSSGERHPAFSFPDALGGDYEVCLDVLSAEGCHDRLCKTVRIADDFFLYIPNAFSPDGDGLNDRFGPVLSRLDPVAYRFWISNRSGQVIWESNDPAAMWNGSGTGGTHYEGAGMYIWQLEAKPDFDVQTRRYQGTVLLLR